MDIKLNKIEISLDRALRIVELLSLLNNMSSKYLDGCNKECQEAGLIAAEMYQLLTDK